LVLGFAAGFVVGRWWALALVALVPVIFLAGLDLPFLADPDGEQEPEWAWAIVLWGPGVR
jgi:hypothetical protein